MPCLNYMCFSLNSLPRRTLIRPTSDSPLKNLQTLQILEPTLSLPFREKILCLEIMGVDSSRALALNPSLESASLDSIHNIISFLRSKGIHSKDFARLFGMCPKILTSDIRKDLNPVFNFLSHDLNVPEKNYRKTVNKCPKLLVSSVRDQLKPALIYLQRLGFDDTDALAYQYSVLLVSNVEKVLIPKLNFLASSLGLDFEGAKEMIQQCPSLFTFSLENNLKPKLLYFVEEMEGTLDDLKEFPQYFSFNLEKTIKPRHKEMADKGIRVPLALMLGSTDEEFRELLQ